MFGNGKTAAKFFVGRYVTTTNTVDEWLFYSPAGNGQFVTNTNRPWTDANSDYVADCDLLNPAANGECGPMANPNFAQGGSIRSRSIRTRPSGWNKREYSWDLTAGITQEIAPRVSLEVEYIRRSWGNLKTTVNRALTPADFDTFVYNVPQDPRLPDGGGYALTFRDVKPGEVRRSIDNSRRSPTTSAASSNNYNGVDVTVNARLRDVTIQGGTSTGNVVEDECGVVAQHPEMYISGPAGAARSTSSSSSTRRIGQWPQAFCHRESGWQTNFKGLASYTVPEDRRAAQRDVEERAVSRQQIPERDQPEPGRAGARGPIGVETNLGRPLSSGNVIEFLNIVQPGAMNYDRLNQVGSALGQEH